MLSNKHVITYNYLFSYHYKSPNPQMKSNKLSLYPQTKTTPTNFAKYTSPPLPNLILWTTKLMAATTSCQNGNQPNPRSTYLTTTSTSCRGLHNSPVMSTYKNTRTTNISRGQCLFSPLTFSYIITLILRYHKNAETKYRTTFQKVIPSNSAFQ